jgi:hypothetical protein
MLDCLLDTHCDHGIGAIEWQQQNYRSNRLEKWRNDNAGSKSGNRVKQSLFQINLLPHSKFFQIGVVSVSAMPGRRHFRAGDTSQRRRHEGICRRPWRQRQTERQGCQRIKGYRQQAVHLKEILAKAGSTGHGWVDYKWVNPVSKEIRQKSACLEKAEDVVIATGFYKKQDRPAVSGNAGKCREPPAKEIA